MRTGRRPCFVEHCGWPVENKNARIGQDRFGDLDHLLLSDAKSCDNGTRRDRNAQLLKQLTRMISDQAAINDAEGVSGKPTEENILFRREAGSERQFLVNNDDTY